PDRDGPAHLVGVCMGTATGRRRDPQNCRKGRQKPQKSPETVMRPSSITVCRKAASTTLLHSRHKMATTLWYSPRSGTSGGILVPSTNGRSQPLIGPPHHPCAFPARCGNVRPQPRVLPSVEAAHGPFGGALPRNSRAGPVRSTCEGLP